jgi:hypothetical protein
MTIPIVSLLSVYHLSSIATLLNVAIAITIPASCCELYAEGSKVSVRKVLAMMPDVSSTSTVKKYYAAWKKELNANPKLENAAGYLKQR